MLRLPVSLALLPLLALSTACGTAPATAPSAPQADGESRAVALPLAADPGTVALAAFDLVIDSSADTAVLTPVRAGAAIGDTFSEVGLMPAFDGMFGSHFKFDRIERIDGETLALDFTTSHPFTTATRPDLGIFNLKLWTALEGPGVSIDGSEAVAGVVANADGYGRMWSATAVREPAGLPTLQPYVILHEDPNDAPFDWRAPAGWNVLFPGQSTTDTLEIKPGTPGTQLRVRLFLTADYGQSAVRATRQDPQYSLPEFAGNAPWKIAVTEQSNDLEAGVTSSSAVYKVDIWDWKHGQGLGSDVIDAQLHLPAIHGAPLDLTLSGTGTDPTPLTADALVLNGQGAAEGIYWGMVSATDSATGVAIKEDLVTAESVGSYITYQFFPVTVADTAFPPEAVVSRCGIGTIGVGIEETFDGSGSLPGSVPITLYEWDFDYDGVSFTVEGTGQIIQHAFTVAGTPTVALRVTAGSLSDIATLALTITGVPLWSGPQNVTTNNLYDAFLHHRVPADGLAATPDGTIHLVYHRRASLNGQYTVIHQMLPACSDTWTPETIVYDTTLPISAFANLAACATSDGVVHTVYGYANGEYGYSSYSGGTWSTPFQAITRPASNPTWWMVTIAGGASGKAAILAAGHRYDQPNMDQNLGVPAVPSEAWFTERSAAGSWSPLTLAAQMDTVVSYAPGSHSWWDERVTLAGLADGEWLTVVSSLRTPHTGNGPAGSDLKLRWNRTTAGTWGAMTDLYVTTGTQMSNPNVATAPNGDVWLAFKENSSVAVSVYRAGAWSATRTTVYPNGSGGDPMSNLSFDPDGRGTMATLFNDGSVLGLTAKRFGQAAQPTDLLAIPSESMFGSQPFLQRSLAAEGRGDGRIVAVFNTARGGTDVTREIEWLKLE